MSEHTTEAQVSSIPIWENLEEWVRTQVQTFVQDLLLYLHGLAHRDFDLALRGLLGETAPLSASTVARLKEKWQAEWERWLSRRLDAVEVTYLWVDGVYVKAGLEKDKAALVV
ncbi:MAG: transposase, partial [Armatimonadota bacterium]